MKQDKKGLTNGPRNVRRRLLGLFLRFVASSLFPPRLLIPSSPAARRSVVARGGGRRGHVIVAAADVGRLVTRWQGWGRFMCLPRGYHATRGYPKQPPHIPFGWGGEGGRGKGDGRRDDAGATMATARAAKATGGRGRCGVVSDEVAELGAFHVLTSWVPCCPGLPQTIPSHPIWMGRRGWAQQGRRPMQRSSRDDADGQRDDAGAMMRQQTRQWRRVGVARAMANATVLA